MGYYSSLDIDLKAPCSDITAIQDSLDSPRASQDTTEHDLLREALLALINERKEMRGNYKDLLARLYQVDALFIKRQRRLEGQYVQLSIFDQLFANSH